MYSVHVDSSIELHESFSQIFGAPPNVSKKEWPKSNGILHHHLLTIDLDLISDNPFPAYQLISVFWAIGEVESSKESEPLTVLLHKKNKESVELKRQFPADYNPWWSNDSAKQKIYEKGISFRLEKEIDFLTDNEIERINAGETSFDELGKEEEALAYLDKGSHIGGVPIWFQDDETPKDKNGNLFSFFIMINGFDEVFTYSPIGEFFLYFFYHEGHEFKWIIQR